MDAELETYVAIDAELCRIAQHIHLLKALEWPAGTEEAFLAGWRAGNARAHRAWISGSSPRPETRTMPTAPRPGAVAMAAMGSVWRARAACDTPGIVSAGGPAGAGMATHRRVRHRQMSRRRRTGPAGAPPPEMARGGAPGPRVRNLRARPRAAA